MFSLCSRQVLDGLHIQMVDTVMGDQHCINVRKILKRNGWRMKSFDSYIDGTGESTLEETGSVMIRNPSISANTVAWPNQIALSP